MRRTLLLSLLFLILNQSVTGNCDVEREKYFNSRRAMTVECDGHANNSTHPRRLLPFLITCLGPCGSHHLAAEFWRAGIQAYHEAVGAEGSISWMLATDNRIAQYQGKPYPGTAKKFFLHHPNVVFQKVLHQVKCPLNTIAGFSTFLPSSFKHVSWGVNLPLPKKMRSLDCLYGDELEVGKGSLYCQFGTTDLTKLPSEAVLFFVQAYIKWNQHIESYADWRYRIEDTSAYTVCVQAGINDKRCLGASNITRVTHANTTITTAQPEPRRDNARDDAGGGDLKTSSYHKHGHRDHGTLSLAEIRLLDESIGQELSDMMIRYGYNEDCSLIF